MLEQQTQRHNLFLVELPMQDSFKSFYKNEINAQLEDKNTTRERKYILKMLLIAAETLYWNGIYVHPNIIELFYINGYKSSAFYFNATCYILNKIKTELNGDINWINYRAYKKGSNKDKNIILCCLLFTYRDYFINFLQDYLIENKLGKEENIRNLISNLQKIINDAQINNNNKNNKMVQVKSGMLCENKYSANSIFLLK